MVQVLLEVHVGHNRFEQHLEVVQSDLGAILVCEVEKTVEDDGLVLDAALVEEHDRQAEEVPHEDYAVEYLGVDAKAIIYLLLLRVFPVRLTSDIRYIEESQVLHDAENNPNANDAGALKLEIRIITCMSNPKHEPDQDE